jgi:pilus assembly protein CpaE
MRVFIVSDQAHVTTEVRNILLREGLSCPQGADLPLDLALAGFPGARPDLVVVVLSPNPERVLACLGALRAAAQTRLLVIGPASDSRLVLRALRAGAHDYADEDDLEGDLPAVLARIKEETNPQGEQGRVIGLLAPSGGSGSSTLAVNIATVLAKEHQTSLLIDLKLASVDLAALLDLKPTHTLADLCQNAATMDRVMYERSLVRHSSGVHLLAAPNSFRDIGYVTGDGVRQALALGRALFPYVVLDLDHSFREEQFLGIQQADVILLIMRLDFASLCNTRRSLDYLEQCGVNRDRVRLVVNRYGQPKEVPAAKAEEALGGKIFHYVPDDPKTINRANNNGIPAVLEYPSARVCRSVTQLTVSINGRHKK